MTSSEDRPPCTRRPRPPVFVLVLYRGCLSLRDLKASQTTHKQPGAFGFRALTWARTLEGGGVDPECCFNPQMWTAAPLSLA